jgi:hypothetical protein
MSLNIKEALEAGRFFKCKKNRTFRNVFGVDPGVLVEVVEVEAVRCLQAGQVAAVGRRLAHERLDQVDELQPVL